MKKYSFIALVIIIIILIFFLINKEAWKPCIYAPAPGQKEPKRCRSHHRLLELDD